MAGGFSPQVASIEALGRLRDADSFEFFVSLLESPEVEVIRAAHASLVRLSCQDFGTHKKKWTAWFDKHSGQHRVEWLIGALMHSDERLRRRASDELKHLTQEYFGYEPGLSKKEREVRTSKVSGLVAAGRFSNVRATRAQRFLVHAHDR